MNIALGSMFRNSEGYISRYFAQFKALVDAAPEYRFDPILVEGDSTDRTREILNAIFLGCVSKRTHGGPWLGVSGKDWHTSTDTKQCMSQIAFACDGVLERARPEHDALIWVESDLIWEPETILRLILRLEEVDVVSPLCVGNEPQHFQEPPLENLRGLHPMCTCTTPNAMHLYDWWGFRAHGNKFTVCPPFHPMLTRPSDNGLYPLDTAGSCLVMRGSVARESRCKPADHGISGLCENIQEHGYQLWLDPSLRVRHP